jgi:ATP-dependent Clp protease ATP-binding subunit ClpA
MTSNVGSDLIRKESALGFAVKSEEAKTEDQQYERMKDKVLAEMKKSFRPEFLNRVDSTLVFHTLSKEHIREIVDMMLKEVAEQIQSKGFFLEVSTEARDWLGETGYDPLFGARPLRRVIQERLEDSLSDALLRNEFQLGDTIRVELTEEVNPENEDATPEKRLKYERVASASNSTEHHDHGDGDAEGDDSGDIHDDGGDSHHDGGGGGNIQGDGDGGLPTQAPAIASSEV